jgi:hypothetical protein
MECRKLHINVSSIHTDMTVSCNMDFLENDQQEMRRLKGRRREETRAAAVPSGHPCEKRASTSVHCLSLEKAKDFSSGVNATFQDRQTSTAYQSCNNF